VLLLDLHDHRRDSDAELVDALRARDPLALAEAYHRTVPAAHAVARRLVGTSNEVEALLRAVYAELWEAPPIGEALEGWVRGRAFAVAAGHLRAAGRAAASPSAALLLPDLPRPEVRYLDVAERAIAELAESERRALVLAHDRGVPTEHHDDLTAGAALQRALDALAGPEPGQSGGDAAGCDDLPLLADHVLGLVEPLRADEVAAAIAGRPGCGGRARTLRRGRRRLEGLPPTPDAGQRVLVTVLSAAPGVPASAAAATPDAVSPSSGLPATGSTPGTAPGTAPRSTSGSAAGAPAAAPTPRAAPAISAPGPTAAAARAPAARSVEAASAIALHLPAAPPAASAPVEIVPVRRAPAQPPPAPHGGEQPDRTEDLAEVSAAILADLSEDPPSGTAEQPPPGAAPEDAPRPDRGRVFDGELALAEAGRPPAPAHPDGSDREAVPTSDDGPQSSDDAGFGEYEEYDDEPGSRRPPAPPRRRGLLGRLGRMTLMLLAPALVAVLLVNLLWSALVG